MSDVFSPDDVARQLDYCTYCPKMCRHACPVASASARETFTPQAKMNALNQLRLGRTNWNQEATESMWACTGCRQCTTYCEHGNEPGLVLLAGRSTARKQGSPHPNLQNYAARFRTRDARLSAELKKLVAKDRRSDDAVVGYMPGCDAIGKSPGDVFAALALFDRLGAGHVRIVDIGSTCGGYPLIAAGELDAFRQHAARVATALNRFRTLVVNCSACIYTMRAQFRAEGVELTAQVLSLSEFLVSKLVDLPTPDERRVVYYHDPCHLARYVGVIEEPRKVLRRVAEVREFSWSGTDAECCGAGGLLPKTMPKTADSMAKRRLQEIGSRGGGTVVTSCSTCSFMLRSNAPDSVEVRDLPGFVAEAIGAQLPPTVESTAFDTD